jgi:ergothioneine biosynthesis protein EgtB
MSPAETDHAAHAAHARALAERFTRVRLCTEGLAAPLSAEDCGLQSMPDTSPTKWHLAHTTWFFETLVLGAAGEAPFDPAFGFLFNSYYEAIGPRHARPRRGLLSRPSLAEVLEYRADVDRRMAALLERAAHEPSGRRAPLLGLVELGLHHEQQHQELILTDIKHALADNPLRPGYRAPRGAPVASVASASPAGGSAELGWVSHDEGVVSIGHGGGGFAFDNEEPRHKVHLRAFQLADRPATAGEVLEFIADRGYARPELWLSDGFAAARAGGWEAPLYWEPQGGGFAIYTLDGLRPLDPREPACHLSFYEADAFARWAGARLPTEAEWESIAARAPVRGNLAESGLFHPAPAPARASGSSGGAPRQLFGDVWEWTASAYLPYPGFRPWEGAVGEYNGKFMSGQMVLRGGSCATPESHLRASYRNFFSPGARWQLSGVRLARDAA